MKEIYDKEHDVIRKFLSMGRRNIEMLEEIALEYKPFLMGKRFMTDAQLSERLGISRRTLQDFRDRGIIPFYSGILVLNLHTQILKGRVTESTGSSPFSVI